MMTIPKNTALFPLGPFLILTILISSLVFTLPGAAAQSADLEAVFEQVSSIDRDGNPNKSFYRGSHEGQWRILDAKAYNELGERYRQARTALLAIDDSGLTRQEQISKAIMKLKLENEISGIAFKRYLVPFNAEGGFYNRPLFFLARLPFSEKSDYEAYLRWLPSYADYLRKHQDLLRQGMSEGILPPKLIVENNLSLLKPWLSDNFKGHPFAEPFSSFPDRISASDREELLTRATDIMEVSILPAYQALHDFLQQDYLPACPEEVGISEIPRGAEFYEDRVCFFTTLEITPDSVFQLGMSEVRRIRSAMEDIIEELKFEGGFDEFITFLREDEQFYPKTPEEYLYFAAWLSKKAEGALPPLFSKLYELPFTVEPVPDAIAPNYTGGRYVGGSRDGDRAGRYWVNTYNLGSRPFYVLPALTLHEAVPGHHLQGALASELQDIPDFRRSYYISAFGEGWGLYAEYLGEEMGMYATPYEWFGRYTYEMWRACRLVVDVGMHYKGWDRQQAVDFMSENTALSLHEVNTEINRYIGWPGQAISYKVGEITIKRLRQIATAELGDQFDVQVFHRLILENGSVPLSVLEELVGEWINTPH